MHDKDKIHLFELSPKLFVRLDTDFRELIFTKAFKKAKEWKKLAKIIDTTPVSLYAYRTRGSMPISILKHLSNFLDIEENEFEKNIKELRSGTKSVIKNPIMPIEITEDLGIILAAMLGDGGVSKRYEVHYSNTKDCLIDSLIFAVKNIFGDVQITSDIRRDNVRQIWMSSVLGRILVDVFGIPRGDKGCIDYSFPPVVFENKKLASKFLRRLFDDEGFVEFVKKGTRSIRLSWAIENEKVRFPEGPQRFVDLRKLLDINGIKCQRPRVKNQDVFYRNGKNIVVDYWEIAICNRKNLKAFEEKVGFDLKYKMDTLSMANNSYVRTITPKSESLQIYLNNAVLLSQYKQNLFTARELASQTGFCERNASGIMRNLKNKGLVTESKTIYFNKRFRKAFYSVTNKGFNLHDQLSHRE